MSIIKRGDLHFLSSSKVEGVPLTDRDSSVSGFKPRRRVQSQSSCRDPISERKFQFRWFKVRTFARQNPEKTNIKIKANGFVHVGLCKTFIFQHISAKPKSPSAQNLTPKTSFPIFTNPSNPLWSA